MTVGGVEDGAMQGAIILCGGVSSRMGMPKAELPIGDESMLARIVRIVGQAASDVVVVAAPGQLLPTLPPAVTVVRDRQSGRGPLEGLYVGLATLPSSIDVAFVVSCDSPLIESAFVERLLALCLSSGDSDVVVPRDEHRHWLCAMYRRRILSDVESLLAAGERKMGALDQVLSVKEVAVETLRSADPKLLSLRNVNHPKDYLGVLETLGLTVDQEILRRLQAAQSQQ